MTKDKEAAFPRGHDFGQGTPPSPGVLPCVVCSSSSSSPGAAEAPCPKTSTPESQQVMQALAPMQASRWTLVAPTPRSRSPTPVSMQVRWTRGSSSTQALPMLAAGATRA